MALGSIGKLVLTIGANLAESDFKKAESAFKSLRSNALLISGAATGALYGVQKFVQGTIDGAVQISNMNQQLGLSISELNKWSQAAQLSNLGISAEEAMGSIGNLQKQLTQLQTFGGDLTAFSWAGINIKGKDAFQVLEDLRENIKGMDDAKATNLIQKMGLSPNMLSVLRLSNAEFNKLSQNKFLSPNQYATIVKLGQTIQKLTLHFKALKDQAVAKIAPVLTKLINDFFGWMEKNGDKVMDTLAGIAKFFTDFGTAVGRATGLLANFFERTLGVQNGLKVLAVIIGALALSFAPVLLGLGLIIGFLDDIAVWKAGGDSLFGGLYDGIAKLYNILNPVFTELYNALAGLKPLFLALQPLIEGLGSIFKMVFGIALGGIQLLLEGLTSLIKGLTTFLGIFSKTESFLEKTAKKGLAGLIKAMGGEININPQESNINSSIAGGYKIEKPMASNIQNTNNTTDNQGDTNINIVNHITGVENPTQIKDVLMEQYKLMKAKYGTK